jgi:hypothetical protein
MICGCNAAARYNAGTMQVTDGHMHEGARVNEYINAVGDRFKQSVYTGENKAGFKRNAARKTHRVQ